MLYRINYNCYYYNETSHEIIISKIGRIIYQYVPPSGSVLYDLIDFWWTFCLLLCVPMWDCARCAIVIGVVAIMGALESPWLYDRRSCTLGVARIVLLAIALVVLRVVLRIMSLRVCGICVCDFDGMFRCNKKRYIYNYLFTSHCVMNVRI